VTEEMKMGKCKHIWVEVKRIDVNWPAAEWSRCTSCGTERRRVYDVFGYAISEAGRYVKPEEARAG
jgi:hypothetical protein